MSSVTRETVLDPDTIEAFLGIYRASFAPLDTVAAARQSFTDDEFRHEMSDPDVIKILGRDRRGDAVALGSVSTNLDTVPWISAPFWRHQFPEQASRNAILYVGAILVRPESQGSVWSVRILREITNLIAENDGIAAFDCCAYNNTEVRLPELISKVSNTITPVDTIHVDTQNYYAFVTNGWRDPAMAALHGGRVADQDAER